MPLLPTDFGTSLPVDGYGPGFFRIGGVVYHGPVLVMPERAVPWGGLEDLDPLLALGGQVDLLFLGMGGDVAHPPKAIITALEDVSIRVEAMASPAAARSYNVLLSEGRRVAAALLEV